MLGEQAVPLQKRFAAVNECRLFIGTVQQLPMGILRFQLTRRRNLVNKVEAKTTGFRLVLASLYQQLLGSTLLLFRAN